MDAGNVICDEAWYDSVSLLGDSSGSDNNDNDYSSVSRGPLLEDVIGGTNAAPCKDAVCLVDTMQRLQSIADAEACQGEKNGRAWRHVRLGLSWALSRATSPHHQRKKSAIVGLSFRWRSYKGNEMTKMTGSAKYLYLPRAGLTLPYLVEEKPLEGCWSVLEPSVFRVRDIRGNPQPQTAPPTTRSEQTCLLAQEKCTTSHSRR